MKAKIHQPIPVITTLSGKRPHHLLISRPMNYKWTQTAGCVNLLAWELNWSSSITAVLQTKHLDTSWVIDSYREWTSINVLILVHHVDQPVTCTTMLSLVTYMLIYQRNWIKPEILKHEEVSRHSVYGRKQLLWPKHIWVVFAIYLYTRIHKNQLSIAKLWFWHTKWNHDRLNAVSALGILQESACLCCHCCIQPIIMKILWWIFFHQ